ncbi:hypothetical protein BCR39DRAFT_540638 [Naematelia encephala]|uniref:Pentatricopeptide repeat domain-containing protein n=1 Tax=Naematelia encephala TaxID=71784 RepID=A0A1Y2AVM1_9TREE|nr:hypothetical protein BCR39DRAFT_540638 [Naematelia encephala]
MLVPSITRRIIRARSLRQATRSYASQAQDGHVLPQIPPNSPLAPPSEYSRMFPLYPAPKIERNSRGVPLHLKESSKEPEPTESPNEIDVRAKRVMKREITLKAVEGLPPYKEADLRKFYVALVESGLESTDESLGMITAGEDSHGRLGKDRRREILAALEDRLIGSASTSTSTLKRGEDLGNVPTSSSSKNGNSHLRIATVLRAVALPSTKGKEREEAGFAHLSMGLVGRTEWNALFEEFIERNDARGAEALLEVMANHGMSYDSSFIERIQALDAELGRSHDVARLSADYLHSGLELNDKQHDAFLSSLFHSNPPKPDAAIAYLREFESLGQPRPQSSYNLVLFSLATGTRTFQPNSRTRALAWDLFSHMRLMAHPLPTKEVYCTMIRLCSDPRDPQPERARDLWVEMTNEGEKIDPQRQEYDAIIRALSSTKETYLEAFDLLRQMLARHFDATFVPFADDPARVWSRYVPTAETFSALLEGTKRAGELNRARWILSEVVRLGRASASHGNGVATGPDSEIMTGVFMTYAAWQPTVRKDELKIKESRNDGQDVIEEDNTSLDVNVLEDVAGTAIGSTVRREDAAYHPQTSADAIREADALFDRILHDQLSSDASSTYATAPFRDVRLTTRLVNAYLSVHLAHAPSINAAREKWVETWSSVSVKPNGWSYLFVLEKCATGTRWGMSKQDRIDADSWGAKIWDEYHAWSNSDRTAYTLALASESASGNVNVTKDVSEATLILSDTSKKRQRWLEGLGERQTERAWRAAVRIFAISGDLDRALGLLEEFHKVYPPTAITQTYKPYIAPKLEISMAPRTDTAEPDLPPHLLFSDVSILHERCLRDDHFRGMDVVKFITSAYEGELRTRMKWRLRGVGVERELANSKGDKRQSSKRIKGAQTKIVPSVGEPEVVKKNRNRSRWNERKLGSSKPAKRLAVRKPLLRIGQKQQVQGQGQGQKGN